MSDKASGPRWGTISFAMAAVMLSVQVIFLTLVVVPEDQMPASLKAIGPTLLFSSCTAIFAIPAAVALGVAGAFRKGRQRLFGLVGLALTAISLLVGYLAQAGNWRQ